MSINKIAILMSTFQYENKSGTEAFIEALTEMENQNAELRVVSDSKGQRCELTQVRFWPGFESDVKEARRIAGIDSRLYNMWVESFIETRWAVGERAPTRMLTPEERRVAQKYADDIESIRRQRMDFKSRQQSRLIG